MTGRDWRDMTPEEFGHEPALDDDALFPLSVELTPPPEDGYGTGDLFDQN